MANQQLGNLAIEEIREAMRDLRGPVAKYMATQLAARYECSVSRIYDITRDLRPRRKTRADKGRRTAGLLEHDSLRFAAELVVLNHIDPAVALETVRLNGYEVPISLGTFRRYLREHEINRSALAEERRKGNL